MIINVNIANTNIFQVQISCKLCHIRVNYNMNNFFGCSVHVYVLHNMVTIHTAFFSHD